MVYLKIKHLIKKQILNTKGAAIKRQNKDTLEDIQDQLQERR